MSWIIKKHKNCRFRQKPTETIEIIWEYFHFFLWKKWEGQEEQMYYSKGMFCHLIARRFVLEVVHLAAMTLFGVGLSIIVKIIADIYLSVHL